MLGRGPQAEPNGSSAQQCRRREDPQPEDPTSRAARAASGRAKGAAARAPGGWGTRASAGSAGEGAAGSRFAWLAQLCGPMRRLRARRLVVGGASQLTGGAGRRGGQTSCQ